MSHHVAFGDALRTQKLHVVFTVEKVKNLLHASHDRFYTTLTIVKVKGEPLSFGLDLSKLALHVLNVLPSLNVLIGKIGGISEVVDFLLYVSNLFLKIFYFFALIIYELEHSEVALLAPDELVD